MPTPFTHLEVARRLLVDEAIPEDARALLNGERGAFLLGSIAADARVSSGVRREDTHFYAYDKPITEHPWRVMTGRYPQLARADGTRLRAFVAGYVAHLSMDEVWSLQMTRPYFGNADWGPLPFRLLMLNLILIHMDERDYDLLPDWERPALCAAQPEGWLPFMRDADLRGWRDFIGKQLPPEGASLTLPVIGERVGKTADELRALLDSTEQMERDLWAHVPRAALAAVEAAMYDHARAQMEIYLLGFSTRRRPA